MSSMSCCLAEDENSILDTSGSVSHTSSYLITSNPGVDNEGNTPCNSREAIHGEEQLFYPTQAATTRHHVSAPVADIIAASDDPMIDHCTNRMDSTLRTKSSWEETHPTSHDPRGERKRACLRACLSVPRSCFQNIFGSFDQKELGSQSRNSCQVNPTLKKRDRKPVAAGFGWIH